MNRESLSNKNVWVTGASSGIGEALAVECYRRGARVFVSSRDETKLQELRKRLLKQDADALQVANGGAESPGERISVQPLDVTDRAAVERAARAVLDSVDHLDLLILAAGVSQRSLAAETTPAVLRRIMDTNFYGSVDLARAVVPRLLEGHAARIVVVTSAYGKFAVPRRSAYAASKHALHGYFDALRTELPSDRVAITLAVPGAVATGISQNALLGDGRPHGSSDAEIEQGLTPAECARRILRAAFRGREEVAVGFNFQLRLALFLKPIAPRLLTYLIRRIRGR